MNWTASVSHRPMALFPVLKSATGDLVTSTNGWGNLANKSLRCYSKRLVSPCGNAGIGRLLPIMGVSSGQDNLEPPLNSRPGRRRALSLKCEKAGINWTARNVQYTGRPPIAVVGRRHE